MQLAQVVLTYPPPADTLGFLYGANVGPDGVSRIARIRPARYQVKVTSLGFEDQTQNLKIIPARTDTICFVMRSARLYLGSPYGEKLPARTDEREGISQATAMAPRMSGAISETSVSRGKAADHSV